MLFSSLPFLFLFLPVVIVSYFLVPKRFRWARNGILLLCSLFFYMYAQPRHIFLMLVSICGNYFFALLCEKERKSGKKHAMWGAVIFNVGLLAWFKYANFMAENLRSLGMNISLPEIILPIGISFFTFQGLSYVLDVARGDAAAEKNPFHVALYISLFPQLVAGPIVRYTTIREEIGARRETFEDFSSGAVRFLFGLGKKVLLSNVMGQVAAEAFSLPTGQLSVGFAWFGAISYTLQIYFDFSGYSDMAIGLGKMFGFHFLENFDYPYIASSITEFWRRWHMSLSSWFRDYLYIPLGGNRNGKKRQVINLLFVWTLTGFWHGASWSFVVWGLYYGLLLIGEKFLWGTYLEKLPRFFRHLITMTLVIIGWVIFHVETLPAAGNYIAAMFGMGGGTLWNMQTPYYLRQFAPEYLFSFVFCLPIKPWIQKKLATLEGKLCFVQTAAQALLVPILALFVGTASVFYLAQAGFNPFIYFQF